MFFNVCLHLMMNVVVLVIYFFNVNLLLIICFAAGAFSLDQPGWLLRYVLCQQCWLGGLRFFLFPSYFSLLFLHGLSFFSRGNLGRRMVEESTLIQDSDRFVKKIACYPSFHFQHHFGILVFWSFSILLPQGSPSTTRAEPLWQRWPPESSRTHKDPDS